MDSTELTGAMTKYLATIVERMKLYDPDEMLYVVFHFFFSVLNILYKSFIVAGPSI